MRRRPRRRPLRMLRYAVAGLLIVVGLKLVGWW